MHAPWGFERFMKTNQIKLQSAATSLFDVQRWTFNVRCSSLKVPSMGCPAFQLAPVFHPSAGTGRA
jgi:hypothetical protein